MTWCPFNLKHIAKYDLDKTIKCVHDRVVYDASYDQMRDCINRLVFLIYFSPIRNKWRMKYKLSITSFPLFREHTENFYKTNNRY